jgi:hypothetical protein
MRLFLGVRTPQPHMDQPAKNRPESSAEGSRMHDIQFKVMMDMIRNSPGCFSIFKRGMTGVYQHCGEKHLQRYLNALKFRGSSGDIIRN